MIQFNTKKDNRAIYSDIWCQLQDEECFHYLFKIEQKVYWDVKLQGIIDRLSLKRFNRVLIWKDCGIG